MKYQIKYSGYILALAAMSFIFIHGCKEKGSSSKDKMIVEAPGEDKNGAWPKPQSAMNGIDIYKNFEDIEPIFNLENDTTYIINFWATWCKPCIKELPYFNEVDSLFNNREVKVILVSLDFPDKIESQLIPFVKKNQLRPKVVVLLDGNYNKWIDKVSPEWTGAIPATYIYNGKQNRLIGSSFENTEEIIAVLEPFL
ncbi:TlpA family protein disulfide reductase [Gramella lutea]|uniref:TlpA family protein disulfide reductase n=1 Tax=Christiangramia lutea TaxID=1607951 RepID=A0A9X1V559_9FLAO|nr:TlpA disulfide reductase family protein [Christiangramia lutea]MCH4824389.1 TlpA family protein disulfide reductase [Christiangramia lutea]